jgi:hypothetical protein
MSIQPNSLAEDRCFELVSGAVEMANEGCVAAFSVLHFMMFSNESTSRCVINFLFHEYTLMYINCRSVETKLRPRSQVKYAFL